MTLRGSQIITSLKRLSEVFKSPSVGLQPKPAAQILNAINHNPEQKTDVSKLHITGRDKMFPHNDRTENPQKVKFQHAAWDGYEGTLPSGIYNVAYPPEFFPTYALSENADDLAGKTFGMLEVIKPMYRTKNGKCIVWLTSCECGKLVARSSGHLKEGLRRDALQSCGCNVHGFSKHRLYKTWRGMIDRCTKSSCREFANYGGRGITVCDEWLRSPEAFFADMEESFQEGLTLDRIDNDKGYSNENCRWATPKEQARNRRTNVLITAPGLGEPTVLIEAAEKLGLHPAMLRKRVNSENFEDYQRVPKAA